MERVPLLSKNMNVIHSSDSDSSDADSPPKIRKTRSTRTVRRPATSSTDHDDNTEQSEKPLLLRKQVSVYSSRVKNCLDDLRSGRLQLCVDKDEDEKATKELPPPPKKEAIPTEHVETLDLTREEQDSSCITTPESSFVRSRSPTPPPTPGSTQPQRPARKRRLNRNIQKALRTLEGMKDTIMYEQQVPDDDDDDDDDIILVSSQLSSPLVENKDITAMVRYKSKIYKYTMGKGETFHSIKTKLASDIDEDQECLFFMLGDRNILPTDSPRSVRLHIADIIDCHVYRPGTVDEVEEDIPARDAISLFVQCQNRKNKILIKVNKHQPLRKLMTIYAMKVKTELSYLKFMFDGEDIMPHETPDALDMDDNDTIDALEV